MRKIYNIGVILCFLISFSSCEKDNMQGPDAAFFGAIKDSVGGAFVEQDIVNGTSIVAYEHGYETPSAMYWDFKPNGEFRNNLVFSNTYDLYIRNGNCYPVTELDYVIKPGDNFHEFLVVPYLRIKDAEIKWDQATNKIVATFKVEAGKPDVNLKQISLYCSYDIYLGDLLKYNLSGKDMTKSFKPSISPDPSTVYTLTIDVAANSKTFKSGRNYYFRIGALAEGATIKSVKYNYAPCVKITL